MLANGYYKKKKAYVNNFSPKLFNNYVMQFRVSTINIKTSELKIIDTYNLTRISEQQSK